MCYALGWEAYGLALTSTRPPALERTQISLRSWLAMCVMCLSALATQAIVALVRCVLTGLAEDSERPGAYDSIE